MITSLKTEATDTGFKLTTTDGRDAGKLDYLASPETDGGWAWVFSYPQVKLGRLGYIQQASYRKLAAAEYAALAWAIDNL